MYLACIVIAMVTSSPFSCMMFYHYRSTYVFSFMCIRLFVFSVFICHTITYMEYLAAYLLTYFITDLLVLILYYRPAYMIVNSFLFITMPLSLCICVRICMPMPAQYCEYKTVIGMTEMFCYLTVGLQSSANVIAQATKARRSRS